MADAPKLKPCPFCGGGYLRTQQNGYRKHADGTRIPTWWETVCDDCDFAHAGFDSKEESITAWNTRADLIDMDVLRRVEAAFRRAVDDLHEWAACKDALEKAGFNVDDTQNRAEHGDAALADLRAMMEKINE